MKIFFPIFLFAVWFVWIPAVVWGRELSEPGKGSSVFPVFPIYPLVAWGLSAILDWLHPNAGFKLVGGLHVILLLCFVFSALRSLHAIRKRNHKSNIA